MRLIDKDALIEAMGEEPLVWNDEADEIAERMQWQLDMSIIEEQPTIEPCEDAISREDAVANIECWKDEVETERDEYFNLGLWQAIKEIKALPSVAPSRPEEESIIETRLLESSTREAYEEGYAKGKEESRPSGEWIPVKERKPTITWCKYLVSLVSKDSQEIAPIKNRLDEKPVCISYYFRNGSKDVWSDIPIGYEVVAWMPLPEPYKESE